MSFETDHERMQASLEEAQTALSTRSDEALQRPFGNGWSAAQHLDHALHATSASLRAASVLVEDRSDRILREGAPTDFGMTVLGERKIPVGAAQAPDGTKPVDRPDRERLVEELGRCHELLGSLAARGPAVDTAPGRLPHPILGEFNAKEWLRFADVHLRHHLAIVAGASDG